MPQISFSKSGFTLVEILVSIGIIAAVLAIAIPNLRGLNEVQNLKNISSSLMQTLRQAQYNTQTGVLCSSSTPSKAVTSTSWSVFINNSGKFYIQATCKNPNGTDAGFDTKDEIIFPSTTFSTDCISEGVTGKITFIKNNILIDNNSCTITISYNQAGSEQKVITINRGGAIYESN